MDPISFAAQSYVFWAILCSEVNFIEFNGIYCEENVKIGLQPECIFLKLTRIIINS